jgi:surface protein
MTKTLFIALNLFFISHFAAAQDFITTWNMQYFTPITVISFQAVTTGPVDYTWQTLSPAAPLSGSGTFTSGTVSITGLPGGGLIRLSIQPQNFRRFSVLSGIFGGLLNSVNQWGSVPWISFESAFQISNFGIPIPLQIAAVDIPNLSQCTSLANMFADLNNLNSPFNLNSWNVSTITNLSGMFRGCSNFNQALSLWNTSNVTNMSSMFEGCTNYNLNIGNWNTSNVTNMSKMFKEAVNFNKPIGNWNTTNVTNMSGMFETVFNNGQIPLFNQNIGGWNTSSVLNMSRMFYGAESFNQNIGSWNTANVNNMSEMFYDSHAFNQNIGNWNVVNVTNMAQMFVNGPNIYSGTVENYNFNNGGSNAIQNWNTANVVSMSSMFLRANNFNYSLGSWALNPAVNMTNMLDRSGLDCKNYTQTLLAWSANPNTPNNRILGATFMEFGPEAQSAVNNLIVNKGWGFSGHDIIVINPSFSIANTACQGASIPALPTTSTNGITGTWSPALNNTTTTIYTFLPTVGQCAVASNFTITVNPIASPTGSQNQTLNSNSTVSNIAISPSNVKWYATLSDATLNINQLLSSTVLVNGMIYFAVNDNGQCRSQPLTVTVSISLSNTTFDLQSLKIYPNPATNNLQITYSNPINSVEIYSVLGQLLISKKPNATEFTIDVSNLPSSLYLVKIKSENQEVEVKIVKQR